MRNSETPYRPFYNPSFRVGKNIIAFNFKLHSFKARKIKSLVLRVEDLKLIFLLTVSLILVKQSPPSPTPSH